MGDHSKITWLPKITWLSKITWLRIPRGLSVVCALALAGCVPHSAELASRSDPVHAAGVSLQAGSDGQICRPSPALLVPPSAPDCAFRRSALKTIDPGEFSRLKVEYELKCYQRAEQTVRQRLRLLQAANRCQIASARQ
jgi:hypothetical protein